MWATHQVGDNHWRRELWGTGACPLDFQLFNFSDHAGAAHTLNIPLQEREEILFCVTNKHNKHSQ